MTTRNILSEAKLDTSKIYFHGSMSNRKSALEKPSYRYPFYITQDLNYAMAFATKLYSSTGGNRKLTFGNTGYVYLISINPNAEFFDFRDINAQRVLISILSNTVFNITMDHCRQLLNKPNNTPITDIWEFGLSLAGLVHDVKTCNYSDKIWTKYSQKTIDYVKDRLLPLTDYVEEEESHEILAYIFEKLDNHPRGYKGVITTEEDFNQQTGKRVKTSYAVGIWNIDGFGLIHGGALKYKFCEKIIQNANGSVEQQIQKYVKTYNALFKNNLKT